MRETVDEGKMAAPAGTTQFNRIFHLSFPANAIAVRETLRAAIARFMRVMTADEAGTLELILAEILNNIVEHSYEATGGGTITLSMVRDAHGLSCSVSDDGMPLPMTCLSKTRDSSARPSPETLPEGGFGWFLICDLATELGYTRAHDHNLLAFRLPLEPVRIARRASAIS